MEVSRCLILYVQRIEDSGRQEYRMDWVRIPPDGKLKLMQTVDCRL